MIPSVADVDYFLQQVSEYETVKVKHMSSASETRMEKATPSRVGDQVILLEDGQEITVDVGAVEDIKYDGSKRKFFLHLKDAYVEITDLTE